MSRLLVKLIVLAWFAALSVLVYWFQDWQISRLQYARPYRDALALPHVQDRDQPDVAYAEEELPQLVNVMALGYDQMVAGILWIRAIQAFGAKLHHIRENPHEMRAIENVFNAISELDPKFVELYKFGNYVLGDEGGDQEAALRLLDRGIVRNYKRAYRLPYEAIFICLNALHDYKRALYYTRLALKCVDCPSYVARMENHIAAKRGNYEIALERWVRDTLNAHFSHQTYVRELARAQIAKTINDWHFSIINAAMDRYFERHRDYPARLEQLYEEKLTTLTRQVDGPRLLQILNGAMESGMPIATAVDLIMGTKDRPGCIIESDRLPRDIYGQPYLLLDTTVIPVQRRPDLSDREKVQRQVENLLWALRRCINQYRDEHKRFPLHLTELPDVQPDKPRALPTEDPLGYPWKYDPQTGKISSYAFPEL
ncbi:MAG: hypothetical protein N3D11_04580 [Candidatus Sumerlaeia bacterium]|nr:hypothetical protein [Candidatus Sumerlaeia bacterium]